MFRFRPGRVARKSIWPGFCFEAATPVTAAICASPRATTARCRRAMLSAGVRRAACQCGTVPSR